MLGLRVSALQKELVNARERAELYNKRNEDMQYEVMRLSRAYDGEKRIVAEFKENITDLEDKVQLETLEKYIPKKTWDEIKPIIDKLKAIEEPTT